MVWIPLVNHPTGEILLPRETSYFESTTNTHRPVGDPPSFLLVTVTNTTAWPPDGRTDDNTLVAAFVRGKYIFSSGGDASDANRFYTSPPWRTPDSHAEGVLISPYWW